MIFLSCMFYSLTTFDSIFESSIFCGKKLVPSLYSINQSIVFNLMSSVVCIMFSGKDIRNQTSISVLQC